MEKKNLMTTLIFKKKVKKWTLNSMFALKKEIIEVACTLSSDNRHYQLLPLNHTQHLDIIALNCLWPSCFLNLAFVFLSNICPKVIASSLYTILAYEGLPKKVLLSDWGGKLAYIPVLLPSAYEVFPFVQLLRAPFCTLDRMLPVYPWIKPVRLYNWLS